MIYIRQSKKPNSHQEIFSFSFILTLIFLAVTNSFAQKNLKPGFIVSNANDTLQGFINYRNWEKNPDKIEFYQNQESMAKEYSPVEIKGFTVSGETYKSAIIKMDDSPYRIEDLKEGIKYNYVTDTVFLLNLVNGEKSLYSFMDLRGKEHFYIPNSTGFELLLYKQYLRRDEATGDLKAAKIVTYIGQVNLYLQGCKSISTKLKLVKYERKSLINLFIYYYECSDTKMISQNKAVSKPYEFGVLAGVSFAKLKYLSGMDYMTKADFPVSTNFSAGIFYNILFPRNFGRLSISNELFYYSFKSTSPYVNGTASVTTSIGLNYVMMHNMVQYKFPAGKAAYFIKGGASFGYGFNETNYQKFDETVSQRASEGKTFKELNKAYLGITAGGGFKIQKYTVQIRYMLGLNKSDFTDSMTAVNSRTNAGFLFLGYEF